MIKLKQILTEGKGDCYQAGGRLIFNFFGEKNVKLVHGMVSGQGALEGVRFGHCWVEYKDKVLDHSNDRKQELSKDIYYLLGRIDPNECHYYTPEEAAKKMTDIGHWGPWDMTGLTVKDTYGDLGPEEYKELVLGEVNTKDVIPDQRMEIGKHDIKIPPHTLDQIEDTYVMGEVDYHSKLSRGHKPDYYQLGTSEFKPFDKSRDEDVEENFADGKKPGRKGISKRVGIPKKATLTQLAKLAKAKGEKGRMARWQLNMRRGKKKKKSS